MVDLGLKCGYQSEEKTVGSNIDWHIKYLTAHLKRYLRTPENIASLKSLIKTDIMGSIDKNIELGNITLEDGHSFMATRKEVELISRFQRKGLYQWILRIIYKTFEINKEGMRWAFILIQVMTVLQRTRIVNCILIRQVCLNIWTEFICTNANCISVSHARRFGKSHAAFDLALQNFIFDKRQKYCIIYLTR